MRFLHAEMFVRLSLLLLSFFLLLIHSMDILFPFDVRYFIAKKQQIGEQKKK